mgnify:CR=1 FL=1
MTTNSKRVPAIDKCFAILDLMAKKKQPMGINDIARELGLNKSTIFYILHHLADLDVLERDPNGLFRLGSRLFVLGSAAGGSSDLIRTVHPFLEEINTKTKLSAFLGIRSGQRAVIVDKVDTAYDLKISSEIGMRLPLLAGVAGKVLMCQLPDERIDALLAEMTPKRFTAKTPTDREALKSEILKVRETGVAVDLEEYIEGVIAFGVPLKTHRKDFEAAVWAVGLSRQVQEAEIPELSGYFKDAAHRINLRFSVQYGTNDPEKDG